MGRIGLDPDGDARASFGRVYNGSHCAGLGSVACNHVSRWREQDQLVWMGARGNQCRDAGGRPRVAAHRLEYALLGRSADLFELLDDQKTMAVVGENVKLAERRPR